jgi:thioredoxin 1
METPHIGPLAVTETTFQSNVLESQRPVLVDFSAEWCVPCRVIAPVIEALATDYRGRLTVATIDIDANPELAERYGVRSIPTVMLVADGEIRRTFVGARPAQEYRAEIEALLH